MKLIRKNKVISTILAVAIALSMILGPAIDSQAAGWKNNNNGWWYENSDGSYPVNEWKSINGAWYYFDANGTWLPDGKRFPDSGTFLKITEQWQQAGRMLPEYGTTWMQTAL